jgi:hypothetical protein
VGQEAQDRIGGGAVVVRTAIRPISESQDMIGGGAVVVRAAIRPISESQDMIGGGAVVVRAAIWPISDGPDGTEAGAGRPASKLSSERILIVNRFNLSLSSANSFSSAPDT